MATLAEAGRINDPIVEAETARLKRLWQHNEESPAGSADIVLEQWLDAEAIASLDLFDRVQLEGVLAVCLRSRSLSDAGRTLFAASRSAKARPNDADRLKKYLARFGLDWDSVLQRA
jgi:transcriptional regulatory protein RtcR